MPSKYPPEFRQRALRLLQETLDESESGPQSPAIKRVAVRLGIAPETLRRWRGAAQVDAGDRPGMTSGEREEIRRLKRENAELRRANEILKTASAFFAAELDRPTPR